MAWCCQTLTDSDRPPSFLLHTLSHDNLTFLPPSPHPPPPPLSFYVSLCLSVSVSMSLSVCLSACLSICLSACLSVCLSLSLFLSLSLSLSLSLHCCSEPVKSAHLGCTLAYPPPADPDTLAPAVNGSALSVWCRPSLFPIETRVFSSNCLCGRVFVSVFVWE